VEQVAETELGRGGNSTRALAQRRARRSFAPEGRSALMSYWMSRQGMAGGVHAQWPMRNHVVVLGQDRSLVAAVHL
jgi:hypothetical protein